MKIQVMLGILILAAAGCKNSRTQTITSTTDADGALHPAQLTLSRTARVKCIFATGNGGAPAKCNVNGAATPPNETVVATGKVYLFCEGAAPLKCSASVEQ